MGTVRVSKIIYSVTVSSEEKYRDLFLNSEHKPGQQAQKYHRLLCKGLSSLNGISVEVVSKLPINRRNFNKRYLKGQKEINKGVNYYYISIINVPIIRNICAFYSIFLNVFKRCNEGTVIIGDVLNITTSIANIIVGKIKGVKTIGIVTDIPSYLASSNKKKKGFRNMFFTKPISSINSFILQKFDSYIFLTEQMNTLINKKNKPYIVMEGHVDINMGKLDNDIDSKYTKRVCLYAGSLKSIYGIKTLTEAFINANVENSELHIYGNGDFADELDEICKKYEHVHYFGIKLNDYIVKEQLKATLLINPRPTNEEYTKYSFPSKNMEYMASGTPTLTTKLAGMPREYYDYVYLIEDESLEGLTDSLQNILTKSKHDLHDMGMKAKEFVLTEKNNIMQANKILELVKRLN